MRIELTREVAVVTGAAQGNGLAIARGLAAAGAAVALLDIDGAAAAAAATTIVHDGNRASSFGLDVSDYAACQAVAQAITAAMGPASILVNNAGLLVRHDIDSPDFAESWRRVMTVNVDGTMNMVRALLPQLRATRGCIVNVGSITSFAASARASSYVTSKGNQERHGPRAQDRGIHRRLFRAR